MKHLKLCVSIAVLIAAGCGGSDSTDALLDEPFVLPADPGDAGKTTVAGIDSDSDGVRDDIQRYIAETQPDSRPTRAALRQQARMQQRLLIDASDREQSYKNAVALGHAIDCVFFVRGRLGHNDYVSLVNELRAEFLNTSERTATLFRADAQLGGRNFPGDFDDIQSHCSFDTSELPKGPGDDDDEKD